jgi:hypothetical protein
VDTKVLDAVDAVAQAAADGAGILLSAMLLATHFAIHILNHWNG